MRHLCHKSAQVALHFLFRTFPIIRSTSNTARLLRFSEKTWSVIPTCQLPRVDRPIFTITEGQISHSCPSRSSISTAPRFQRGRREGSLGTIQVTIVTNGTVSRGRGPLLPRRGGTRTNSHRRCRRERFPRKATGTEASRRGQ